MTPPPHHPPGSAAQPDTDGLAAWLRSRGADCVPERILPDGAAIGPFRVLGLLGRGGNAEVCRARREADGIVVALKIPLRADSASAERFRREARLLERCGGAALPRLVCSGESDGRPWIALEELVPGDMPRAPRDVERFVQRVCDALARLHALGYVHRDVKPGNVLFRTDGSPVLIDMGYAKETADAAAPPVSPDRPLSLEGSRAVGLGTPGWAAPEQFAGGDISPAADVYALGMLALHCFGGRPPFSWRRILRRATAPIPSARYKDAAAFARALRSRRRPFLLAAAGAAALLAAAAVAVAMHSNALSRRAAESERQIGETLDVVRAILSAAKPGSDAGKSDATVLEAARRALPEVRAEPDPALRARLATEFGALFESVGRFAEAEALFGVAVDARRAAAEADDALAEALLLRGRARRQSGRADEAVADLEAALAVRRAAAARNASPENRKNLARAFGALGAALSASGRGADAAKAFGESVAIWRTLAAERPDEFGTNLARALHNLGVELHELERHGESTAAHEEALRTFRARSAAGIPGAAEEEALALAYLGDALRGAGRLEESRAAFGEALPRLRALADAEPGAWDRRWAAALGNHALLMDELGEKDEAAAGLETALDVLRRREKAEPGSCAAHIAAFEHDLELVSAEK